MVMTTENQNNTSITNTSSAGNGINKVGLIYLLVSILGSFLFIPTLVIGVFSLIDGIKYLMCSDEEFERVYVQGKKAWF